MDRDHGTHPPSIFVVAPYFGELPNYLPLILRSMAQNHDITWYVPTDASFEAPPNVIIEKTTFADFRDRCQRHFDFPLAMKAPYKITDLRPAFGEIFAEQIADADFWGHSDWDVIFGDIRSFLTPDVLTDQEKILVRGSFALYRNNAKMNALYRQVVPGADYREVFGSPDLHRHFDEWGGIWKILQTTGVPVWSEDVVFDINPLRVRPAAIASRLQKPAYRWGSGRVHEVDPSTGSTTEGLAVHLQKRAMRTPAGEVLTASRYWIGADTFALEPRGIVSAPAVIRFYRERARRKIRPYLVRTAPPGS